MIFYCLLLIAGLIGGFLGGLIGVGGGIVFVLVLPEALRHVGVPNAELTQYVIANSLFATMFSAIASSITNFRKNNFYPEPVLWIASTGIIISYLTITFLVNTPLYDKTKFNMVVILLLLYMMYRTLKSAGKKQDDMVGIDSINNKTLMLIGTLGGLISPLSGLGGGIIIIPILNAALRVPVLVANSVSLGVIALVSFSVTISNLVVVPRLAYSYYSMGYIVFPVALALSVGVIFGSMQGIIFSRKLPSRIISYIFSLFMVLVILKKLGELIQP